MADGIRFKVEIDDGPVRRAFASAKKRAEDLSPLMRDIGAALADELRMSFVNQADPYGNPWVPLKSRDGQALMDSRRMANSMTFKAYRVVVDVGTNVKQARLHNFGGTIVPVHAQWLHWKDRRTGKDVFAKRAVIPARPFMPLRGLPPSWESAVIGQLSSYFGGALAV